MSRLISLVEYSNITHSYLVKKNKLNNQMEFLTSNPKPIGVRLIKPHIKKGEILIVMRVKISNLKKEELNNVVEKFIKNVEHHLKNKKFKSFAETRSWLAVFVGFFYMVLVQVFKKSYIWPNPYKSKNGFFCSEMIDFLFKKINIFLAPRSEFDSTIGPSEFLYSPYLEFKGFLCNEEDIHYLKANNLKL